MRENVNVLRRLGAAKGTGFFFGLVGFFLVPVLWPDAGPWFRWGMLLWYTTFGVLIGLFGFFDRHPLFKFPLPFWLRGTVFGAWLNLVLTLVAYEKLAVLLESYGAFSCPFWMVAEGAVIGLIVDAVATRVGGDGPVRN